MSEEVSKMLDEQAWLRDGRGLMPREISERTRTPMKEVEEVLRDLAAQGLAHYKLFHWYPGPATPPHETTDP